MGPKVEAALRFVERRRAAQRHHVARPHRRRRSPATSAPSSSRLSTDPVRTEPDRQRRRRTVPDAIEVRKVPIHTSSDASGLAELIDDGVIEADRVIAVIGKTEGNGGVNDYTRIIADRAFREVLVAKGAAGRRGQAGADRLVRRHRRRDQPARDDLRHRAGRAGRADRRAAADGRLRDERAAAARGDRHAADGREGRRRP